MAEVFLDGVGVPVNEPEITGAEVNYGAAAAISNNATSPKEQSFDGVGTPVALGNRDDIPENFDNEGKNVTYGATATISNNATSPKEESFDGVGVPVGDGNRADFPVSFDNQGKNVVVTPQAGPAVGNAVETTFFSPPLNFNP